VEGEVEVKVKVEERGLKKRKLLKIQKPQRFFDIGG
jgi:hypothetical protein